ncbi:transposase, MuDR, MULE transposase domain protein [Tanacetum coccineum]
MSEDLTYSSLNEMMIKKFNMEANSQINLSFKLSSFDCIIDIIDDDEIRTFLNCLCPLIIIDAAHLKGLYKGTNLLAVGMDGNNQIVPIAFGICKGETGPCWTWWMSVLKECIDDKPNLLFISDRHPAIALAVQNEFPLAFHVAYTREDFATSMRRLQLVQPDAYQKLCKVGPQRWSIVHCPLVRYNYMTSNSVESVNAYSVLHRKVPVLKLAETYCEMGQEWFTSPPGREFVGEMVATIDPVKLDTFSTEQVKLILTNCLGYDGNSSTFLYIKKPNCSFDSGLVLLANAMQERDMILTYT